MQFLSPSPIVRSAVLLHNDQTSSAMTPPFSAWKNYFDFVRVSLRGFAILRMTCFVCPRMMNTLLQNKPRADR
jgi:hypothetical protein